MRDNSNDLCWVKYVRRLQIEKNTTFHSTIGMTPYEALYNRKQSFGLSDLGIPIELALEIHDEEDLERIIDEINHPPGSEASSIHIPRSNSNTRVEIPGDTFPQSNFNNVNLINDVELPFESAREGVEEHFMQYSYLDEISQPLPGVRIFSPSTSASSSSKNLNCVVCKLETSGVHKCPRCCCPIHLICGREAGEEGYGSSVWCPKCDIEVNRDKRESVRKGIKRKQEQFHQRIVNSAAKRFDPAHVGDNVIIPIERQDQMNSLGQRNMLGVVSNISDDHYNIGTKTGTLNTSYTRNQFDLCSSNRFLHASDIPGSTVTPTCAMRSASLGIQEGSFCKCTNCKTNRCPCRKSFRTKCHLGKKYFNK